MSGSQNFKNTIYACFTGYIVQAIVNNFVPLLFVTFQREFSLPLSKITLLVTFNFGLQLLTDLASVKFVDRIGYRISAVLAHLLSAAGLIAAAFIGMLLNRNARIRAQLQQTQINESRALAALSERACGEGDYLGALRLALQALPGEGGERPYVAEAERALSGELNLYRRGVLGYVSSLEQDAAIGSLALSENCAFAYDIRSDSLYELFKSCK